MSLKIGDKVRFLNAEGGGVVSKILGNGMVAVTDADGFDFPTPERECVLVPDEDMNAGYVASRKEVKTVREDRKEAQRESRAEKKKDKVPQRERFDEADLPDPDLLQEERAGGDVLNFYLAFVPVRIQSVSTSPFECYVINDSNYEVAYTVARAEEKKVERRASGFIHPNTKEFIEEIAPDDVNRLGNVLVQLIAFKKHGAYEPKPAVSVSLKINPVRLVKIHSYVENDFFDEKALLLPVVKDDLTEKDLDLDGGNIAQAMLQKEQEEQKKISKTSKPQDDILVVDLHIEELLDSTAGMSKIDIFQYQVDCFNKVMKENLKKRGQKIVFIHGKGDGVLRRKLIDELKYKYKRCAFQDASFQEYGFGATQVTIS